MPINATGLKRALASSYADVVHNPAMQALTVRYSCYFLLSLLLSVIFALAVGTYWSVQAVVSNHSWPSFGHSVSSHVIGLVERIAVRTGLPPGRTLLFLGIISILWAASSGFSAVTEALNIAYDVGDERQFWHTRFLAVTLVLSAGILLLVTLAVVVAGPRFGAWSAARWHVPSLLVATWLYVYWLAPVFLTFAALEALYFIGPNVKQRFGATLPGVFLAAGCCLGVSGLMEVSFRRIAAFGSAWASIGAAAVLIAAWVYWSGIAILLGGALNSELSKLSVQGKLQQKTATSRYIKLNLAA
jgi:membrane protein